MKTYLISIKTNDMDSELPPQTGSSGLVKIHSTAHLQGKQKSQECYLNLLSLAGRIVIFQVKI